MSQVTGVLVKLAEQNAPSNSAEIHKVIVEGNFEGIAAAIKAPMIEVFYLKGFHGYCDDEGKISQKPVNVAATGIAHRYGFTADDVLCGDVLFLGEGEEGEEADLPEPILNEIMQWRDGK